MQEKISPAAGAMPNEAKPVAHRYQQIVLWPLQIVPSATGNAAANCGALFEVAAANTPWRRFYAYGGPEGELSERHYREFISFFPHAQRFLYGEAPVPGEAPKPGDVPMKVYTRDDVKKVRIVPGQGAAPLVCDVTHISLFFFYEINVAILTCETAIESVSLEAAERLSQIFGRAYPAGWTEGGEPIHCASLVEWLDADGNVLQSSDYCDKERFLTFVGRHRAPCISRHWEYLLSPIVNASGNPGAGLGFKEIEYYRMPVMSYLVLDSLDQLTQQDRVALALATRPARDGIVPFSRRFLRRFETEHVYDRLYSGGLDAPEIDTRFLTSGEAFTIVAAGQSPSLIDNERGLLGQFRHQYFLLFLVAHFQKASLLMIGDQLMAALRLLDPNKPDTMLTFRDETLRVQETFLRFSQRYYFAEISGRAHVRDLFRIVRKHLHMDAAFEEVRGELSDLVQYLDSSVLRKQNASMHRLTVVAVVGLVGTIVTGFLGMNLIAEADAPIDLKLEHFGIVTLIVTAFVALSVIYSRSLANFLERLSGEKR